MGRTVSDKTTVRLKDGRWEWISSIQLDKLFPFPSLLLLRTLDTSYVHYPFPSFSLYFNDLNN